MCSQKKKDVEHSVLTVGFLGVITCPYHEQEELNHLRMKTEPALGSEQ